MIPPLNRTERLVAAAYRYANRNRLRLVLVGAALTVMLLLSNRHNPTLAEMEALRATIYPQNQGVKQ